MPKRNPDGYVDTGASIEDAAMDLDPADFMALMAELGRELFGPPDPRPTRNELRKEFFDNQDRMGSELLVPATRIVDRQLFERGGQDPRITADQYESVRQPKPRPGDMILGDTLGEFSTFLDAWQAYKDPAYPEQAEARQDLEDERRRARMDALRSRVRERIARFKL